MFTPGSMNISSVVPRSDTATDFMTDLRKWTEHAGDARLLPASSVCKWGIHAIVLNRYFPYWKLLFLSCMFKTAVTQELYGGFS